MHSGILLLLPLLAAALSGSLHALSLWLFPKLGLLDFPQRYGYDRAPIPYPTGILSILSFLALSPLVLSPTAENLALVTGIVVLGATCFFDDRTPLSPTLRIGLQALVALLLVFAGIRVEAITNPFVEGASFDLSQSVALWFSAFFTVAWLLMTINALNWFDGIPGQVSILSSIAFLTIGCLSLSSRVNQPNLAIIAFVLAGISFGAVLFDFPPARLLMGDTGAMFFGLMIGVLTIYSGGKVATAFLVLGVPLIDLIFVIVRRLRNGQSPFKGNAENQHLHHRLLAKGWSPRQVILLTAAIGSAFGVTALFLSTFGKMIAGVLIVVLMLGLSWYSKPEDELSKDN